VAGVVTGSGRIGVGRVATEAGSPSGDPHSPQKVSPGSLRVSHVAQRGAAAARRSARLTMRRSLAARCVRNADSSGVTGATSAATSARVRVSARRPGVGPLPVMRNRFPRPTMPAANLPGVVRRPVPLLRI
jgi:hypothetical protein